MPVEPVLELEAGEIMFLEPEAEIDKRDVKIKRTVVSTVFVFLSFLVGRDSSAGMEFFLIYKEFLVFGGAVLSEV